MPTPRSIIRALKARPDARQTLDLLRQLAVLPLNPADLLDYHESLLFAKAYPQSVEIRAFCTAELQQFVQRVRALDDDERAELAQTGVVGTPFSYPYDEPMARWLAERLGGHIDVDWDAFDERDNDPLSEWITPLSPSVLGDALDDPDLSTRELIDAQRGPQTALQWILDGVERTFPDGIRQEIYNKMQLLLQMTLEPAGPSRTLADDGDPGALFLWVPGDAKRPADLIGEITRPLIIPPPVDPKRGQALLNLTYSTLLPRLRELYPATHGNPAEVYDIFLERGVRVIVWFMLPEFRLPLEAGWGLLVLKNNVPIGYGAGGMLADRSEIAINVFDTFRGGEAAWLYSQYARIFHAFGAAPWLVTRKYQIGYENEEGIASGSYWFYDKLGFRSTDAAIRKLADQERRKIARQKGYRTPRRILKQLCRADVVLSLNGEPAANYREFPLKECGLAAARVLSDQLGGDASHWPDRIRQMLKERLKFDDQNWSRAEQSALAGLGLMLLAIPDWERWPARDLSAVLELFRAKGSAAEADYARAFPRNSKFFDALRMLS